jgi:hypothetical protein
MWWWVEWMVGMIGMIGMIGRVWIWIWIFADRRPVWLVLVLFCGEVG